MFSNFSIKHANVGVRQEAKLQLVIILLISFLPLIIGFMAIAFTTSGMSLDSIYQGFISVFLLGQLYFYAISICAYIAVLAFANEHRNNRPMRLWSGVFVIFCAAFMAFYIGQGDGRNTIVHGFTSVAFLLFAILINYRVIVLSQQPPPTPEDVNRQRIHDVTQDLDLHYD